MNTNIPTEAKEKQPTEVIAKQKQEHKHLGTIKRKPGLTLFEWDMTEGVIKEAEMQSQVIVGMDKKPRKIHKVTQKQNCVYFQALNMKNAIRKCENKINEAKHLLKQEKVDIN